MMTLTVLGPGCANCTKLEKEVHKAVAAAGIEANIKKITDYTDIAAAGVTATPGLMINGEVVVTGRVPRAGEIEELMTRYSG
ncbi:thioredoxin family protein [Jonesia quinghaiensis]|uniref:thioredoxin family protein n=1 Tax=Jonesia quinghaiensis TaxID=262806 RepID=UPI00048EACC3|nr:thioredoxin family protein [Jonesia quinghaiensis]